MLNVQFILVLHVPGPDFGSEESSLLLTKAEESIDWFLEVPPTLHPTGRGVPSFSALGMDWLPGQTVSSVVCHPQAVPHNGFRAGEAPKD